MNEEPNEGDNWIHISEALSTVIEKSCAAYIALVSSPQTPEPKDGDGR